MPLLASLRDRYAGLIPELAKFGVVGATGAVVDLGGADYLHVHLGVEPLIAKAVSLTAATVVTYLGSRFWTFRHRVSQPLLRGGALFVGLNVVGLAIAEVVIAATTYGLGLTSALAYNAASVVGTGLGTIFRYFSYKKWVFLADVPAAEAAVSGITEPGRAAAGAGRSRPPWEELERPADLGDRRSGYYGPAWEHLDPAEPDARRR